MAVDVYNIIKNINDASASIEACYDYKDISHRMSGSHAGEISAGIQNSFPDARVGVETPLPYNFSVSGYHNGNISYSGNELVMYNTRSFLNLPEPAENVRMCLVRIKMKPSSIHISGSTSSTRYLERGTNNYYRFLLLSNSNATYRYNSLQNASAFKIYSNSGAVKQTSSSTLSTYRNTSFIWNYSSDYLDNENVRAKLSGSSVSYLTNLFADNSFYIGIDRYTEGAFDILGTASLGENQYTAGIILNNCSWLPIFDVRNVADIINWLTNGEKEEESEIDVEEANKEQAGVDAGFSLENYATTWDIYLTAGDGNGRAVITASCADADSLGADGIKKVKTVYSVDPKTSYLFDSKYKYQEKAYKSAFGTNLSDIARNEGGSAWLDSNNDPKGNHTLYGMLYTGAGNSIAFSFEWFFTPTANIGISIVESNAVKFWKAAVSPVGSFVIQSTTVEQTAFGWKYTDLYGDVVNVHINESYTEENDVYNPDRGNQYNPQTDTYGGSSGFIPQRGGAYYTYKLTYQELKNVVSQFTGVTWTSVLASIFGGDLWKCLKSLKYTPIAYNGASTKSKLLLGGGTTQVGTADYDYINATYVTPCGTISNISRKYNNFLDYNPYTQFILHLPFTGYVDLPVDEIYNCTLKFELAVDYITGEGLWLISRNGCIRWTYTCNVAANIPLDGYSSAEFAQSVMGHIGISGIASASLSTPVQIRDKQMKMETRSGYLNALDSMSIFYILEYPKAQLPTSSPHDNGRPCGLTKTLSSLKGFTKCKNVDVSGYSCTDAERNELISILESGFYL